jgi:hypothetical protein
MIVKILSSNDTGETGGHQAGILVPKESELLAFFPELNNSIKNPRTVITLRDEHDDAWSFNFIYYNNKYFGGTRNEFRLTGMTKYIRSNVLKAGDEIHFSKGNSGYRLKNKKNNISDGPIKLTGSWITVKTKT